MASNQTKSGYLASLNRAINDPTNPFLPTSDPLTNHALAHINWHSIVLADLFNKREEAKTSMDEASTEIKELEAELRPIQTQISNKKHLVQTAVSSISPDVPFYDTRTQMHHRLPQCGSERKAIK